MYILLLCIWYIFNGKITLQITAFGLVIAGAVYLFMCKYMNFSIRKDMLFCRKLVWAVQYAAILVWEIVKANLSAIHLITSYKVEIEPAIVHFKTHLKTRTARLILANSITLTPGTITISLQEDEFEVHCLDKELAVGMDSSVFVSLLEKLESGV